VTVGLVEPRLTGLATRAPSARAADTGAVRWDGRLVSDATGEAGRLCQAVIAGGGVKLLRGHGHALAGSTPAGVNGLHEMGRNAWEWVAWSRRPGRAPHARWLVVVWRGTDAGRSSAEQTAGNDRGLHRVSLRPSQARLTAKV
jgi:hypothetical protein